MTIAIRAGFACVEPQTRNTKNVQATRKSFDTAEIILLVLYNSGDGKSIAFGYAFL